MFVVKFTSITNLLLKKKGLKPNQSAFKTMLLKIKEYASLVANTAFNNPIQNYNFDEKAE